MSGRQVMMLLGMAIGGAVAGLIFVAVLSLADGLAAATPSPEPSPQPQSPAPTPQLQRSEKPPRTPIPIVTATPRPSPTPSMPEVADASMPPDLIPPMNDLDNDGLTDEEEAIAGTDRWSWDTDGGGEPDGAEVAAGRNPVDPSDDQPDPGCIPAGAAPFEDGVGSDELVPVPDLEALIPAEVDGHRMSVVSTEGLPRLYGFFNYFWDGLLLCAGGQPDDLAHAMGSTVLASSDEGFGSSRLYVVFAIRVDGVTGEQLMEQHVSEMVRQGRGEIVTARRTFEGHDYVLMTQGGAVYHAGDVMFWMTLMDVLDSGFYIGGMVDVGLVEATLAQLPG
ncbi:MAG TPA: thrombospondin type 3 repeat-containing protein [Candidatus Limnocylindria bacterium]|nr:thrombospondin type 3 repeat-containing protein [Candidatus Limnocylindria bacterium]